MESLINKLEDTYSRINKAYINFKKSPKDRLTRTYVEVRLENLEKLWDRVASDHSKLYDEFEPDKIKQSSYIKKDVYDVIEEVYMEYKTELKTILESCDIKAESSKDVSNVKQCQVKLPKIVIPVFSGKYTDWVTFRDLFLSLIHHNKSLDNVQRMQYLKGYLSGEPEQLLRQIPISNANYERCWEQLNARYNNKRYISHYILKRLLSQRNLNNESAVSLKELIDNTDDCLKALSNIGIDVRTWDIIVIHIITLKLDPESRKQWELKVTSDNSSDSLPTFDQFKDFLTSRYRALEFLDAGSNTNRARQTEKPKVFHVSTFQCKFCNENHKIINCKKFIKTDVNARREFVGENNLCFNCLGYNHSAKQCMSLMSCRVCKRKHHSLLHPVGQINIDASTDHADKSSSNVPRSDNRDTSVDNNATSSTSLNSDTVATFFTSNKIKSHQVLLATALVNATARNGMSHTIRALLDQGSQASFVTEATAQYLGLKKTPVRGLISGLEGNNSINSKFMVEIILTSTHNPNVKVSVDAYVLKRITSFLPSKEMVSVDWICDLPLADPQYNTPNKIDILLGAEVYGQIIQEGIKKGPQGTLVAQATLFGWIISGVIEKSHQPHGKVVVMHSYVEENELLKKFWEIEADTVNEKQILTEEEKQCESFFAETTSRGKDGRYTVRLPFKTPNPEFKVKNSKKIAEKRVISLVSRLSKNKEMQTKYQKVLDEYLQLGHMEKVPEKERNDLKGIYLPHFAVVREDKDTTQVRIVFDASCKGENGVSLNDLLMIGPALQPTLRHILMKWRLYPICLSADIVKMYRQIKVAEQDIDFQRIVWQETSDHEINEYRLLRVTFGTACAPYLAVKVLQQVAEDEKEKYPKAATRVKEDFYMDDLLTGVETVEEGLHMYNEINGLVEEGGFSLQKWSSNSEELLQKINNGNEENKQEGRKFKIDEVMKLLGLTWNRMIDAFCYTVTLPPTKEPVTKRIIISDISRLFDPLGWVSPSLIVAKMIIQKLWLSGIGWDDEVPSNILKDWLTYRSDLYQLSELKIPRWINTKRNDALVELHGFCDASKLAYAAVVYIRVLDDNGHVTVNLVTAKTKVAPIKQISIPRLELCGAVLLSRLLVEVAPIMDIRKENIHAWTDSTVVLAWLNSHPTRWQTFVANRVSEILTTLDAQQWSHVRSGVNPADYASRGLNPSDLKNQMSWFKGPTFLGSTQIAYNKPKDVDTDLEAIKVHFSSTENSFWDRFSSLTKLVRVVAYCRRMWIKRQKDNSEVRGFLTAQELKDALDVCIRKCQAESFEEEMEKLSKDGNLVNLKGPLKYLNPFIDGNNTLRVGGRLQKSKLSESRKHPILIPKKSILTNLIVSDAHYKTLHGGPQLMLAYLRSKYWILGAKELVKAHVHKCVACVRQSAATRKQLMGQLPAVRVTPTRPFKCSGVDYAGPINIRTSKGRGHHAYKGYVCLFVCMATKAVHIEAVSDLTTQGFLAAYRRFISRRGYCSDIWSDNGTNFVGASRELQKLFSAETSSLSKELANSLASQGTKWHFIPPYSPNFGGLWEAGVKSVKFHLRRVIGDSTLTYEELSTVLTQIEACLNSRPLSRMNNDLDGLEALTPSHFLVGEPLVAVPEYNFESSTISSLRRWQLTQRMMQSFWRRWSQEYLSIFMNRYKWNQQTPEPRIGELVLVKEDDLPPSRWLLGRVVAKHPGADGITRVVSLRTKTTVIKRSISKICILPVMST